MEEISFILTENSRLLAAAAATMVFAGLLVMRYQRRRIREQLPPGPPLEPFVGTLRFMPSSHQWLTFADWSKKWGDVIYAPVLGSPVIILNSIDAARDLLDKRGANYSDRPRAVVYNELISWDTVVSMPYGERFRKHRRLISQVLNSQAIGVYKDFQMNNTKELLKNLLKEPEKFDSHILLQAYTTLIRATYGLDVASEDDALIPMFGKTLDRIVEEGAPGACTIDLFPILKYVPSWIPGGSFQKRLGTTRSYVETAKSVPFDSVKAERRAGRAKPSLISHLLDDYDTAGVVDPEHEYDLKLVGAAMLAAGVETTATTMATFFQMMAKYPEVVKQAQVEIDRITHKERLPTPDDRKDIPIVDCIMKEVFRINAPAPLGIPHSTIEEDTYRDMHIPAGATVIPNIWQMMHEPSIFPDPDVFNPERFRDKVNKLQGNNLQALNGLERDDPSAIVFGFGRRICPGRYFVDASLWLTMSNILAVFDIGPPLDPSGQSQEIGPVQFTDGVTSRPVPFKCTINPRDTSCEALVQGLDIENNL